MFTTYQLVQDFFHPQYVMMFSNYTIIMIAIICISWIIIVLITIIQPYLDYIIVIKSIESLYHQHYHGYPL